MKLKVQLRTVFDNIYSFQRQLNHLIIPPDYINVINSCNDSITGLFYRLLTVDEVNSVVHNSL
jgi:hypothetical protein